MATRGKASSIQYLAGLFDGEGYIGITQHRTARGLNTYKVVVEVGLCSELILPTLQVAQQRWGGTLRTRPVLSGKTFYGWTLHGKNAESLLQSIAGELRVKKTQAKIALRFRRLVGPKGVIPNNIPARVVLYQEMQKLNGRHPQRLSEETAPAAEATV